MLIFSLWWILTYSVARITANNDTIVTSSTESFVNLTGKVITMNNEQHNHNGSSTVTTSGISSVSASKWASVLPPRQIFRLATLPPRPAGRRNSWGPFFEEDSEPHNTTARVGNTVRMDCKVALLHDKTVSWLHRQGDVIHLLTVGKQLYSMDQRVSLNFRYPNNWRLEITPVMKKDEGVYECQIATHPPTVKTVYLTVTVPEIEIVDEKGSAISERYYKAGSQVELTCHASQMQIPEDNLTWWKANTPLVKGIVTNITESDGIAESLLVIPYAQKQHSGNYTCAVGQSTASFVLVHILNGELPAAVHDGSSGSISSSFATIWLMTSCFLICINGSSVFCR